MTAGHAGFVCLIRILRVQNPALVIVVDMHSDKESFTMTEDAKTEEYTAGGPCGAYIEMPCKLTACRVCFLYSI